MPLLVYKKIRNERKRLFWIYIFCIPVKLTSPLFCHRDNILLQIKNVVPPICGCLCNYKKILISSGFVIQCPHFIQSITISQCFLINNILHQYTCLCIVCPIIYNFLHTLNITKSWKTLCLEIKNPGELHSCPGIYTI